MNNGQTPVGATTYLSGPSTDHTTRLPEGNYFFVTGSGNSNDTMKAWLLSPLLEISGESACAVRFHYYMFGKNVRNFTIYTMTNSTDDMTSIFSKSGDQGQKWVRETITVNISGVFQFVIEGVVSSEDFVDIAIDDVSIASGCRLSGGESSTSVTSSSTILETTYTSPSVSTTTTVTKSTPTSTSTKMSTQSPSTTNIATSSLASTTMMVPSSSSNPPPVACDANSLDCGDEDHSCVPGLLACDSVKDCPNGADEQGCSGKKSCSLESLSRSHSYYKLM